MKAQAFLDRLENVRSRGPRKWSARCPAHHPDKTPSLTVSEGERGLLVKCWSGCTLAAICRACDITAKDLFFDTLEVNPQKRKAAAEQRKAERRQLEHGARKLGRLMDACREADWFLRSRQTVDIGAWSDDQLNRELNLIADAYHLLEHDPYAAN